MIHQQHTLPMPDNSPIALLYQREALAIFKYIYRHVPIREDAEDILLEVFLAALENETISDLNEEKQRAWLLRVAHNKVIDHRRYSAYRTAVPLEDVTEKVYSADDIEPDMAFLYQEEKELLLKNLASLPEPQQEVIRMRYFADLRHAEIAKRLNKREGTIRVLLSRSLNFLRDIYKHQ